MPLEAERSDHPEKLHPIGNSPRECLCIGDPSVRVSLEAKRAAHSEKGVPLATSRRECLWEFFTTSHWQPLDECASRGRKGGSFRKTVLHGRLPGKNASGKVFLRQQVLCMTSHWRPLGESASRGRKGDSPRKTASHWRLSSESASGKVFLICPMSLLLVAIKNTSQGVLTSVNSK